MRVLSGNAMPHATIKEGARRLRLLSVLCAEVHLLQLRLGRVSTTTPGLLPRAPTERDRRARVAVDSGDHLPGGRHAEFHDGGRPCLFASPHSGTTLARSHP